MKIRKKTIILIPAKNEELNIKKVLKKFNKYGKTVVVNDHSTDNTFKIANKFADKVLNIRGYGGYDAAIKFGLKYIIKNIPGTYVVTVDADGEHSTIFLSRMLSKVIKKKFVIGNRAKFNRWSEYICGFVSDIFFSIKDPLCGMKCYDLSYLRKNKKKVFIQLNPKINQCGMFFFKIYKFKDITSVNITTNNAKRPSNFGSGILVNLKIIKFFINSIF